MIRLKGIAGSMVRCIFPEDMTSGDLVEKFKSVVAESSSMMKGAKVVLDFQGRALDGVLICAILSGVIWPCGLKVVSWVSYDIATQDVLKSAGLPTGEPLPAVVQEKLQKGDALLLKRSLRSGQRIEHRGDVIISGHVNDGAEVFASGHVVVLGRLHGLVHAGFEGDEGASIAARSMEALQVRISSRVGALDRKVSWWGKPVLVTVEDEAVIMGEWPAITQNS